MAQVFITGDRSMTVFYPGMVMLEMLRALTQGSRVITGSSEGGVEALVREVAATVGLEVEVIDAVMGEDGRPDWDARNKALVEKYGNDLRVKALHVEPMASSVVRSASEVFSDDVLEIVTPAFSM